MNIFLYDDLIDSNTVDETEQLLCGIYFPWYFQNSTVLPPEVFGISGGPLYDFQFIHTFIRNGELNSGSVNLPMKIFDIVAERLKLNIRHVTRIKANLLTTGFPSSQDLDQQYHTDHTEESTYSMIYYVNDSDGDTVFKDINNNEQRRISPKKGRIALFRSNIMHRATNPTHHKRRVVINYIFQV